MAASPAPGSSRRGGTSRGGSVCGALSGSRWSRSDFEARENEAEVEGTAGPGFGEVAHEVIEKPVLSGPCQSQTTSRH